MRIVLASHNAGKITEINKMLKGLDIELLSAEEVGVGDDVEEDQDTFAGNALKKARFVSQKSGLPAVADDSGICIAALDGAPGVMSARWAGENARGRELAAHTLEKMKNVPEEKRQAYFECTVAFVTPDGKEKIFTGRIDGRIAMQERGQALPRLPYDLIFIPDGHDNTFAEMDGDKKNSMSHRGRAFAKFRDYLADKK